MTLKLIDFFALEKVLTAIMNMAVRPTALRPFARVKYSRELCLTHNADGSASGIITLWGWEYKRRYPRPKVKPKIDPKEIQIALNDLLAPDYYVSEVEDCNTYAKLTIKTGGI